MGRRDNKLGNDEDRVLFAARKFNNKKPCDPTEPLTYFGYRRYRLAKKLGLPKNIHHKKNLDKSYLKIQGGSLVLCTIDPVTGKSKSVQYSKKRKAEEMDDSALMPPPPKRPRLMREFNNDFIDKALREYKLPVLGDEFFQYQVDHYVRSIEETKIFLSFYDKDFKCVPNGRSAKGRQNNTKISQETEYQILKFEQIFRAYVDYYGRNEITNCRDCKVDHPF